MTYLPNFNNYPDWLRGEAEALLSDFAGFLRENKICPVAEVQGVAGAVAEASVKAVIPLNGSIDLAGVRGGARLGLNGLDFYTDVTQGAELQVGTGKYSVGGRYTRTAEHSKGDNSFGPWKFERDGFLGLGAGGALILGGNARIGVVIGEEC